MFSALGYYLGAPLGGSMEAALTLAVFSQLFSVI